MSKIMEIIREIEGNILNLNENPILLKLFRKLKEAIKNDSAQNSTGLTLELQNTTITEIDEENLEIPEKSSKKKKTKEERIKEVEEYLLASKNERDIEIDLSLKQKTVEECISSIKILDQMIISSQRKLLGAYAKMGEVISILKKKKSRSYTSNSESDI